MLEAFIRRLASPFKAREGDDDPQLRVAKLLVKECGYTMTEGLGIAQAWEDVLPYLIEASGAQYVVSAVEHFKSLGCTPATTIEWFKASRDLSITFEFAERGYTPSQFNKIQKHYNNRKQAQVRQPDPFENPAWDSWNNLLDTVDPDFLLLALQAGGSDDEIRTWEQRRLADDPTLMGEINLLAGLQGPLPG